MSWNPITWWEQSDLNPVEAANDVSAAASHWLSGIGGSIASGIEGAFVAVLGDIWNVISGPVLAIIGAGIMIFFVIWAFKNQIFQAVMTAAAVAA